MPPNAAVLETPPVLSVSRAYLVKHPGEVFDHVAAGGVVRITDQRAGTIVGWIYPGHMEPSFYSRRAEPGELLDDSRELRARALAANRARGLHMNAVKDARRLLDEIEEDRFARVAASGVED